MDWLGGGRGMRDRREGWVDSEKRRGGGGGVGMLVSCGKKFARVD